MKKTLSILLSLLMLFSAALPAFAADGNGEETVVVVDPIDDQASIFVPEDVDVNVDWDGAFSAIRDAIANHQASVALSEFNIPYSGTQDDPNIQYIKNFLFYEPVLLRTCKQFSYNIRNTGTGTILSYLNLGDYYQYDQETYLAMADACNDAATQLLYGIGDNEFLSDAEKCLILHDRLAAWCGYDIVNYNNGTIPNESYCAYGPLALQIGVCQGYAMAYGWMLDILGIENYYISSKTINHGWNLVRIDDDTPYFIDVTWDDPTWDVTGRVNHTNFLQSFATFSAGHRNATDFTDEPSSTVYEDSYWKAITCEFQLIGDKLYYVDGSAYVNQSYPTCGNGDLKCLDLSTGAETTLMTIDSLWTTANGGFYSDCYARLASIGSKLFYSTPDEIRSYDIATGEDALVYAPDFTQYEAGSRIYGLTQRSGTLYVMINTRPNATEASPGTVETVPFCTGHADKVTLETLTPATCAQGGEIKFLCADCRAIGTAETAPDPALHVFGEWTTVTAATCTAGGSEKRTCANCDAFETRETDVDANNHVNTENRPAIAATCVAQGRQAGVWCLDCQKFVSGGEAINADPDAHDFGDWTAVAAATCSVKGTERRDCTRCDAFETRETALDPTNHVNTENRDAVAATCVDPGREAGVWCLDCQKYVSGGGEVDADPDAHDFGEWVSYNSATCSSKGVERRDCSRCDAYETRETAFDPNNHAHTEERAAVAATCTDQGREAGVYCLDCQKYVSGGAEIAVDPNAHDFGAWTAVTAATCTVKGSERRDCSRCDAFETRETGVDATNHVNTENRPAIAATCVAQGRQAGVWCLDCQKFVSGGEAINADPDAHTFGEWTAAAAGTCTVKGTERRDCADCDAFETRETALDPTNHVNTENREAVAATCTVKGREAGVYCLDCRTYVSGGAESALDPANHVNTEEKAAVAPSCAKEGREAGVYCNDCKQYVSGGETVGKLPHAYTSVVTEPTCTKGGYTTYTCQNCSDSYVSDQTAALGHTDADGNQRCDRCNADLSPEANCSCNCHKGGILGFFFKIKVFFWKLFGLTQYRYCDCGKAHW